MKKIRLAGLILLAPLTLLCACSGGTPLSFTANWYRNTTLGGSVKDTSETLVYDVSFTPEENENGFSVEYDTGTYRTSLVNENITLADGSTTEGYRYTTELTIGGRYRLGGEESDPFQDSVTSTVSFLPVAHGLQPVKSEKEVVSTSPLSSSPASLENAFTTYHYSYTVEYDAALTTAKATYSDLTENEDGELPAPETREYDIEGDTTFLDNEQVLFALRGLTLTSTASFRTINQVTGMVTELATGSSSAAPTAVKETVSFTMDGSAIEQEIDAVKLTLSYQSSPSGQAQTLVYAATTDANDNVYRNVLLKMEVPVLQSLGTLVYTLKEAAFANK